MQVKKSELKKFQLKARTSVPPQPVVQPAAAATWPVARTAYGIRKTAQFLLKPN